MKAEYFIAWYLIGLGYTYYGLFLAKGKGTKEEQEKHEEVERLFSILQFKAGDYAVIGMIAIISLFAPACIPFDLANKAMRFAGVKND